MRAAPLSRLGEPPALPGLPEHAAGPGGSLGPPRLSPWSPGGAAPNGHQQHLLRCSCSEGGQTQVGLGTRDAGARAARGWASMSPLIFENQKDWIHSWDRHVCLLVAPEGITLVWGFNRDIFWYSRCCRCCLPVEKWNLFYCWGVNTVLNSTFLPPGVFKKFFFFFNTVNQTWSCSGQPEQSLISPLASLVIWWNKTSHLAIVTPVTSGGKRARP